MVMTSQEFIENFMVHSQDEPPLKYVQKHAQLLYPDVVIHNLGVTLTDENRMFIKMNYRLYLAKIGAKVLSNLLHR